MVVQMSYTTTMRTEQQTATLYHEASSKIQAAEAKGASQSTLNRLYREFFKIEDELKSFGGFR